MLESKEEGSEGGGYIGPSYGPRVGQDVVVCKILGTRSRRLIRGRSLNEVVAGIPYKEVI